MYFDVKATNLQKVLEVSRALPEFGMSFTVLFFTNVNNAFNFQFFWRMQYVCGCTITINNSTLLSQNNSFLEKFAFFIFQHVTLLSNTCRCLIPKLQSDSSSRMSRLTFCAYTALPTVLMFCHNVLYFY